MPHDKTKTKRQVRYLLSSGSPLSMAQKSKLKGELHTGHVKIKKSTRGRRAK